MTKIPFLTLLVALLVCSLLAAPARAAGAPRTFVSAAGSDGNNCTNVATPCRHLAAAYAATAPNGEIYVLDPANYGSLTITHGVSIEGHGWASIAPVSGSAAITLNADPSDKINIIGVVLDGTALTLTTGIAFNSGGSLVVRDSVIRNFSGEGIQFAPTTSTPSQLFVSNTLVSDNGNNGIAIGPIGSGTVNSVVDHVHIENNGRFGLVAESSPQALNVTVSDSVSAGNAASGILADGTAKIMVRNCTIANNGQDGLETSGTGATIRVTRSTVTGNANGWDVFGAGAVLSYGDNNIDGNTSVNTEPPGPITYK